MGCFVCDVFSRGGFFGLDAGEFPAGLERTEEGERAGFRADGDAAIVFDVPLQTLAFPLFLELAAFFGRPGRGWALASVLTVSFVLHVWLLWRFVNFQWAG
jgi:hypothetical protein